MNLTLLTRPDEWGEEAARRCRQYDPEVTVWYGDWGDPWPIERSMYHPGILVSFLAPWVVPAWMLSDAELAVNFHPGSAAYPGIGGYNFALYEGAESYGVVAHLMEPTPDTGKILYEYRWRIRDDTVRTLWYRSRIELLKLLDVMLMDGFGWPADKDWEREPFTRRQLNELGRITADMSNDEVERRVRAMRFPDKPGVFYEQAGYRFDLSP